MKLEILVPDIDTIIKEYSLLEFFSEIHDADALLTELCEKAEDVVFSGNDLEHGEIWCKFENDSVSTIWEYVEGNAQSLSNYLSELAERAKDSKKE